jgi:methyl-accepting chemotaxis protein
MNSLVNLSVRAKLLGIFAVIMFGIIISGVLVRRELLDLERKKAEQRQLVDELSTLKSMMQVFGDANLLGMDIIVDHYEEPNRKVVREGEFQELLKSISDQRTDWDNVLRGMENQRVRDALQDLDRMLNGIKGLIEAINRGEKRAEIYAGFDEQIDGSKEEGARRLQDMMDQVQREFIVSQERMDGMFQRVSTILLVLFGGSFGFLLFIATPIILVLGRNIVDLHKRLADIVLSLHQHSSHLAETSRQLADSASKTTETIHESVSSMTEMSAMLGQTSRNARATSELSHHVLEQSQEGVEVMETMSSSMKSITESSTRLKEIVQVIDNISAKTNVINDVVFKTQLLAVNASIEAARAGHHGKGFSVVANEVASLAALSGKASAEIRELLQTSSARVQDIIGGTNASIQDGERSSERSAAAFQAIAKSVSTISDKVEQITIASKEQEVSVTQNSTAMGQMNRVASATNESAQRNALLGQEINDLAKHLKVIERALHVIATGHEDEASHAQSRLRRSKVDRILSGVDDELQAPHTPEAEGAKRYKRSA